MSIRGDIVDNVKTTLQGITTGNGYNQTVKYVSTDTIKLPEELTVDQFPALQVVDDTEIKSTADGDVNSIFSTLRLVVLIYNRRANDQENLQDKRRKLLNDVEKVLMVNETRGSKAMFTKCIKIDTDAGIDSNTAISEISFDIEYFHNRKNPSSQSGSPV